MRAENPDEGPTTSAAADKSTEQEPLAASSDELSDNSGAANNDPASNATPETATFKGRSANGEDSFTVADVQAAVVDAQSYISALNNRLEQINADSDEKPRR